MVQLIVIAALLAAAQPITPQGRPYYDPTVVAAGKASRMADWAKIAINCGFEVVTVRPWKVGDIALSRPSVPQPMSLIVQAPSTSDLNKVVGCFDSKTGADDVIT
jgi:hypothetical protein